MTTCGVTGMLGKTHSDETKKKMSSTATINGRSDEHLDSIKKSNSKRKGRKEDPEVGKKEVLPSVKQKKENQMEEKVSHIVKNLNSKFHNRLGGNTVKIQSKKCAERKEQMNNVKT